MKTTPATTKLGLGLTVSPVGVAALVAPLRGMPGVYSDDLAADSFSLILKESLKLGEAPGVEPPFSFPATGFDTTSDIGEVFHDDSCTGLNAIKDRGRQHVVAIPSEALFTPSEASKVPFGTLSTFGLQSTSEAEYPLDDFFHMPVPVKTVVRGDGRPGNSQVNTDSLAIANESNIRQGDDSVQVEMPLAIDKVGGNRRVTCCILSIFGKVERYLHPTVRGRQAYKPLIPVYFEGVEVVPGRAHCGLRTTCLTSLLQPGDSRPHGFTGFVYRLNMQVRDELGHSILATAVNKSLKCVGIASSLLPPFMTDSIERLSKLLGCFMQCFSLFLTWLKLYSYRSIHTGSIPHATQILQIERKEAGQFLCQLKQAAPLP